MADIGILQGQHKITSKLTGRRERKCSRLLTFLFKEQFCNLFDEYNLSYCSVFAMYGKYRKILKKAHDMTWQIVKYDDPEADLILSDLDKMKRRTLDLADNESKIFNDVT